MGRSGATCRRCPHAVQSASRMSDPKLLKILKKGVRVWNHWQGGQLRNRVYRDLTDADLRGFDLFRVWMERTDLTGANLERTNLMKAELDIVRLNKANLTKAVLSFANLMGADLTGGRSW